MKLTLFNFFHKSKKDPLNEHYPDLTLDLKKISKQREIPIRQQNCNSPVYKKQNSVKRSTSFKNVRETFNRLKKSPSLIMLHRKQLNIQRFDKKPSFQNQNRVNFTNYAADPNCSIEEEGCSGEVSIFDETYTASPTSDFNSSTLKKQFGAEYYSSFYPDYCATSESSNHNNSAVTSLDWNKENIPPCNYPLSASKTPNFALTPETPKLPQNSTFDKTNDSLFNTNLLLPPHRFFLNKTPSAKFGSPQNDITENVYYALSSASLPCTSTISSKLETKSQFLKNSPKPCTTLPPLPPLPLRLSYMSPKSASSMNFIENSIALANEPNISEFDMEENSLLEALSANDLNYYSKVTLTSYNS